MLSKIIKTGVVESKEHVFMILSVLTHGYAIQVKSEVHLVEQTIKNVIKKRLWGIWQHLMKTL